MITRKRSQFLKGRTNMPWPTSWALRWHVLCWLWMHPILLLFRPGKTNRKKVICIWLNKPNLSFYCSLKTWPTWDDETTWRLSCDQSTHNTFPWWPLRTRLGLMFSWPTFSSRWATVDTKMQYQIPVKRFSNKKQ